MPSVAAQLPALARRAANGRLPRARCATWFASASGRASSTTGCHDCSREGRPVAVALARPCSVVLWRVKPDVISCNAAMDACGKCGRGLVALSLLCTMARSCVEPGVIRWKLPWVRVRKAANGWSPWPCCAPWRSSGSSRPSPTAVLQ
eukprot:8793774-Alexandrium_andersonii.AAC.1